MDTSLRIDSANRVHSPKPDAANECELAEDSKYLVSRNLPAYAGPMPARLVRNLARAGVILPSDSISTVDRGNWRPAREYSRLEFPPLPSKLRFVAAVTEHEAFEWLRLFLANALAVISLGLLVGSIKASEAGLTPLGWMATAGASLLLTVPPLFLVTVMRSHNAVSRFFTATTVMAISASYLVAAAMVLLAIRSPFAK